MSTHPVDWPVFIATLVQIKSRLSEVDGGLWPYHLPELKATESQVAKLEKRLGVGLPDSYREFLTHANGWKGFFHTVDLLGTEELAAGPYQDHFQSQLAAVRPEERPAAGLDAEKLLCIGATFQDRDLFVLHFSGGRAERVVWSAGELIDQWTDFRDFFLSMIEYNRASGRSVPLRRDQQQGLLGPACPPDPRFRSHRRHVPAARR